MKDLSINPHNLTLNRRLIKSELIQIIVPANINGTPKTKIQFPDNQNLRFTKLMAIRHYPAELCPKSWITDNNAIPFSLTRAVAMTLQGYNGINFEWQSPLIDYINQIGAATTSLIFPDAYDNQKVNWPKSYIEINDSTLISDTEDQAILFKVWYREMADKEKEEAKANFNNRK